MIISYHASDECLGVFISVSMPISEYVSCIIVTVRWCHATSHLWHQRKLPSSAAKHMTAICHRFVRRAFSKSPAWSWLQTRWERRIFLWMGSVLLCVIFVCLDKVQMSVISAMKCVIVIVGCQYCHEVCDCDCWMSVLLGYLCFYCLVAYIHVSKV